jgi:hypothetical protein
MTSVKRPRRLLNAAFAIAGAMLLMASPARALPAFAIQTGQPCASCHVGGYGPQLTAFGREFKLHGYTQRAVSQFDVAPVSMMAVASYIRTQRDQDGPPAPHYSSNDNVTLDEASLFVAGGFGDHFGAFVQSTYDGVERAFAWDNIDIRATTNATIGGADTVLGLSLNNSPTTTDVWNSLPAWGYPYTDSGLAPGPAASPVIADALAQTVLGLNGYAWWNASVYAELGLYWSPSGSFLDSMGVDPADTSEIRNTAPYMRLAYQRNLGDRNFEIGVFGLSSDLYPGRDHSAGATDRYRDLGVDVSYQLTTSGGGAWTFDARYINEHQRLPASQFFGDAANRTNTLNDARFDVSYFRGRFGATVGAFDTWGSSDALLYGDSRTNSPNSSGLLLQGDFTPFGNGGSPFGARFNTRIGVQYTAYSEFDGARHNYDGSGRDASDNNTLRVFTWMAY